MFKHGKTGKVYYSVREKIRYYDKRLKTDGTMTEEQRAYAQRRLSALRALNERPFEEPTLVVTDDKHFGNGMSKPRLCVAYASDTKGRVRVAPVVKNSGKYCSLDSLPDRMISDQNNQYIDRSDIFEEKYVTMPDGSTVCLTNNDRRKIRYLFTKK